MRILEALARVELTDGLNFSQLTVEITSRLPRDATVVAILADVPEETAIALGNLRRRGYAVTAVLVLFQEEHDYNCLGRLLAEGVAVRRVDSEAAIAGICSEQLV
jgi:uncharacterized protein involved in type VI secretion and phage assembly